MPDDDDAIESIGDATSSDGAGEPAGAGAAAVSAEGEAEASAAGVATDVTPIELQEEMERSFLDYAMSVITSRALPDARDGLKPVHRRILYGMYEGGLRPERPH